MPRPSLEVADIFRDHGAAWRAANAGHVSLDQLKVMSAVERCRTAALGGHVARCEDCAHEHVAYNSCRNRHCPKCQAGAARKWLVAREAVNAGLKLHQSPEQKRATWPVLAGLKVRQFVGFRFVHRPA